MFDIKNGDKMGFLIKLKLNINKKLYIVIRKHIFNIKKQMLNLIIIMTLIKI
jgi:hypothetical protein